MKKQEYLALDYPVEIRRLPEEEGGGYIACIPVLGRWSVQAAGDTVQEALDLLEEVKAAVFAQMRAQNMPIPAPPPLEAPKRYQGKIVLRVSPTLHEQLVQMAKQENISLNQFIQNALYYYIGSKHAMEMVQQRLEKQPA